MILLLLGMVFLGLITSYEDIKKSKISNKWIIVGLVYVFAVQLVFLGMGVGGWSYLVLYLFVVTCFCIFLWLVGFWGAGDAKLFIVISLFFPFNQLVYPWLIVPFVVLVLSFILGFFTVLYMLITKGEVKKWKKGIRKSVLVFRPINLLKMFSLYFALSWPFTLLIFYDQSSGLSFLWFIIPLIISLWLISYKKIVYVAFFASAIRVFADFKILGLLVWQLLFFYVFLMLLYFLKELLFGLARDRKFDMEKVAYAPLISLSGIFVLLLIWQSL